MPFNKATFYIYKTYTSAIFLCIYTLLFSCGKEESVIDENLPTYELAIIDSIRLDIIGDYRIAHYSDSLKYYLGVADRTGDIVIFKANGEIITKFNKIGEYHDAIGEYVLGASFYNTSEIVLLGKRGLFFYSLDGTLKRKITRSTKGVVAITNQFKLEPIAIQRKKYIACVLETSVFNQLGTKSTPKFYELSKLVTLIDLEEKSFKEVISYPKEGLFRGQKWYYDQDKPIFDYSPEDSSFYFLFGCENKLYRFHGDDFTTCYKTATTNPTHMQVLSGENFAINPPQENILKYTFMSGFYSDIFKVRDTIYTTYCSGISKDKVDHNLSMQEYISLYKQFNKHYLQVFLKNKKVCTDIAIPNKAAYIDHITSNGTILLHRNKLLLTEDTNYDLFYIAKLSKK